MRDDRRSYIAVGAFVVAMVAALVVWLAALSGSGFAAHSYFVVYANVLGLAEGTQVLYEGFPVGQIVGIEPTAGLDPDSSDAFVSLLRSLHRDLELTVIMVTHDLDTLFELSTRIAVLADKRVIVAATPKEVIAFQHPFIHDFFLGERGQRAMELLREYPFAV